MKAMVIDSFGELDVIRESDVPKPEPGAGEVQIAIAYAGVNPVDWKIAKGIFRSMMPHRFPVILGWEGSGVVSSLGEGVDSLSVGDEVYAYVRKPTIQEGTFCDYVTYAAQDVVRKPKSLSLAQAAVVPLSALTAWQSFFDFADLQPGQSILIHAGAGGVGSYAIQLARWRGARVYTTASGGNHDYVKQLGADVAIDYTKESWEDLLADEGGFDVIFDCVGGAVLRRCYDVVKPGGALVSIVMPPDEKRAKGLGIRSGFVFVSPSGEQLSEIGELFDSGALKPPHVEEFALADTVAALEKSIGGHVRGKLALKI